LPAPEERELIEGVDKAEKKHFFSPKTFKKASKLQKIAKKCERSAAYNRDLGDAGAHRLCCA
jgi:hypothetical protein